MIRLAKLTDYGFVILTRFAATEGGAGVHNARDVAAEVNLPLPTVSKVLKMLARNGLLSAHRGVKGGYRLGRDSRDISVAEIINALEGPIAITDCIAHTDCMIDTACPVRGNWQRINEAVHDALLKVSLAEVAMVPDAVPPAVHRHHHTCASASGGTCSCGLHPANEVATTTSDATGLPQIITPVYAKETL